MSQIIFTIVSLLIVAAVISLVISFLANVIVGALSFLPIVLAALVIWFFVRGGKIHVEFPDRED